MGYLHKVRFETHGTETHVFLDDQEVKGCVSANFDYQINALPVVKLEIEAYEVDVEIENADVIKITKESIDTLNLSTRTNNILKSGFWYNKNNERKCDPIRTISELLSEYNAGRLTRYKGIGGKRLIEIVCALKGRGLI